MKYVIEIDFDKDYFSNLLKTKVESVEFIKGGRNSKVHLINCEKSKKYVAKVYFKHLSDKRDRFGTEIASLKFLKNNNINCIPEIIVLDQINNCAVYDFISGEKITPEKVTDSDIDQATDFLIQLEKLKFAPGSELLPAASEAFFSVKRTFYNLEDRLSKLSSSPNDSKPSTALHEFLAKEFCPVLEEIKKWAKSRCEQTGISYDVEIPKNARTISPSDFGFHNALKQVDGIIKFFDFEYFGWDDPAKMMSDFLLTPAMSLSKKHKKRFAERMFANFENYNKLHDRVKIVYPLFGLKFCCILLNEFLPEQLARRKFASDGNLNIDKVQTIQLYRAKKMLCKINNEYQHFNYI